MHECHWRVRRVYGRVHGGLCGVCRTGGGRSLEERSKKTDINCLHLAAVASHHSTPPPPTKRLTAQKLHRRKPSSSPSHRPQSVQYARYCLVVLLQQPSGLRLEHDVRALGVAQQAWHVATWQGAVPKQVVHLPGGWVRWLAVGGTGWYVGGWASGAATC